MKDHAKNFERIALDSLGVLFNAAELAGKPVPEQQWHVQDMIPQGQVTILGGDGGTGKSLIALQLAFATATHGLWLGREIVVGPVLYLTAEDDKAELHRRLARIALAENRDSGDADRLTMLSVAGCSALLAVPGTDGVLVPSSMLAALDAYLTENPATLLVLDTLADLFGGNENVRTEARQFVQLLAGLALRRECTVLLLAHPSLSGLNSGKGTSGSTAWNNSARSRLYLERAKSSDENEPDSDARSLKVMKSNYGPADVEIALRWREGVFVPDARKGGTLDRVALNVKADRAFMACLREFVSQGRHVSANPSNTYAPSAFVGLPLAEGCTKAALKAAMERALSDRSVAIERHLDWLGLPLG